MNILFLTLLKIETLETRGIYNDLMKEFASRGHNIYIVSPVERREGKSTVIRTEENVHFLNLKTLNIQKTNVIEKGIAILSIEHIFLRGIKNYFSNVKFDLVLYSTPPITFTKVVKYIKEKDGAKSYLLLKDIFPQNAVDMEMMSKNGLIWTFFRKKEKKLYEISDAIGCMSEANRQYLFQHNPEVDRDKVEVNSNSIKPLPCVEFDDSQKREIKNRFGLPLDKKILVYGGNLGIPQGLDFMLESIQAVKDDPRMFFLIVGSGTEYDRLEKWFNHHHPQNAKLLPMLPKDEFDELLKAGDIGLIFLHKNFTIPNFPSRLLSYLEFKLPVLVATDPYTDIGSQVEDHHCGVKVLSGNLPEMIKALDWLCSIPADEFNILRQNARKYLENEFLVEQTYHKIINRLFPER